LKAETESEIIAAQNQALHIKILKRETQSKSCLRKEFEQRIQHIISACPGLE
jgi:hypothetical protein